MPDLLLALVGFAVVAHRAYELSTFDARAFADAFPVSYAPPVGKKAKNAPSFGVVDVSEFTLNYDELNLPGDKKAEMSAETFRLELGGSGFNIFLNLDAVVDRAPSE